MKYATYFLCWIFVSNPLLAEQKRVLVAGGAGFLGSHLCDSLIDQGCEVFCVDNLYTGSRKNIEPLLTHPNFHFIQHDICCPFEIAQIDEIYNLACPASPVHYQKDPVYTIKTNVTGSLNLLELASKHRAKILQTSTSEVYGDAQENPQSEAYWGHVNPIGIRSCYDEGKRCAEALFFAYHRMHNTRIKVARIFNTYGPRMDVHDGRVISNFLVQALSNQPLTLYGTGAQTRSFCYVSDLIDGLIALMESPDSLTGPINLGNTQEYSMRELAELILSLTRSQSDITLLPLPQDDPQQRKPDLQKASELLNWAPKVSIHEGLEKTAAYFRSLTQ